MKGVISVGLALLLTLFAQSRISAQTTPSADVSELLTRVDSLAILHFSLDVVAPVSDTSGIPSLLKLTRDDLNAATPPELVALEAKKELLKGDIGLSLEMGYRENINRGVFGNPDIFYRRRAQFGVEWDLLKNGLLENQEEIERLENRSEINRKELESEQIEDNYLRIRTGIISHFNQRKKEVLKRFEKAVDEQLYINRRLYHLRYTTWDRILELEELKSNIAVSQQSISRYEAQLNEGAYKPVKAENLPILRILPERVVELVEKVESKEALDQQNLPPIEAYNPLTDISLSLFSEYNIFSDADNQALTEAIGGREFFSAGVNLSLPLPFNFEEREEMDISSQAELRQTFKQRTEQETQEILGHYLAYQEHFKDYIGAYRQLKVNEDKMLMYWIDCCLEGQERNPLRQINFWTGRYRAALEMLDIKRMLYLDLLKIYRFVYTEPVSAFTEPVNLESLFMPKYEASGVYLWSETARSYPPKVMDNFLKREGFSQVAISTGPEAEIPPAITELAETLRQNGRSVELLVGDNSLMKDRRGQYEKLAEHMAQAQSLGASALHLDVEPHTFDDWDAKREAYLKQYVNMVIRADSLTEGTEISLKVSIPHFYEAILPEIDQYVDEVTVMVYGVDDAEKIRERISAEVDALGFLRVALRPDDFASIPDMNDTMRALRSSNDQLTFILHDLGSLLNLNRNRGGRGDAE